MFKLFHNINEQKEESVKELQICNTDKNLNECESISKIRQWQKELNDIKQEYSSFYAVEERVAEIIQNDFHINRVTNTYSDCIINFYDFMRNIRPNYFYDLLEKGCFQKLGIEMDKMYERNIKMHNLQKEIKHEKEILGIK